MLRRQAIKAATRAADVACAVDGKPSASWLKALNQANTYELARFLTEHPAASTEAVYRNAVRDDDQAPPWLEIAKPVRVALEVFCGSLRALLVLVREAEAQTAQRARERRAARRRLPQVMRQRTFDARVASGRERVVLRRSKPMQH